MKQPLLLVILAGLTFLYFHNSSSQDSGTQRDDAVSSGPKAVTAQDVVIAPAASHYDRWKTGPTAQNDWKLGPNAQTQFEPFAPNVQATWNQTPGYTIVAGATLRR